MIDFKMMDIAELDTFAKELAKAWNKPEVEYIIKGEMKDIKADDLSMQKLIEQLKDVQKEIEQIIKDQNDLKDYLEKVKASRQQ